MAMLLTLWCLALRTALPWRWVLPLIPVGALLLFLTFDRPATGKREFLALVAPLTAFWILNYRALSSWWLGDDPCHLTQILDHGLWAAYFKPIGYFLTPSLLLSLGVDLRLFGFDPAPFYWHQLVAFSLLIVVIYGFLRCYLSISQSAWTTTLFVAAAPAYAVAQQLMNRHYMEGLIAALGSLWFYGRSVENRNLSQAILGAFLYAVAATAKEVFVPIVVLLPFVVSGDVRLRRRYALPFLGVASLYTLWRFAMFGLGRSLSAYGALSGAVEVRDLLLRVPTLLGFRNPWVAVVAFGVLMVTLVVIARAGRWFALGILVLGAALLGPLGPILSRLESRHLFLPSLAVAAVVVASIGLLTEKLSAPKRAWWRIMCCLTLLSLTLLSLQRSPIKIQLENSLVHHRREGQTILGESREGLLVTSLNHSHHLQCLTRLEREYLGRDDGPGFCGDPCFCTQNYPAEPLWQLEAGSERLSPYLPPDSCSVSRAVEVSMVDDASSREIQWTLGPYEDGAYSALLISGQAYPGISVPVPIPRQGVLTNTDTFRFVIRYQSPEGWRAYSPIHEIQPGGRARPLPSP